MTDRPDVEALSGALGRLTRLLSNRRVHARLVGALGIELSQQGMQVLGALGGADDISLPVGEVARAAHMDVGAVSRQVRALEDGGLVAKTASPGNASVVLVSLTPEGLEVAERLSSLRSRHVVEALSGWSHDEIGRLAGQLDRLLDDLQATPYEER